jgi:hypothetical protein
MRNRARIITTAGIAVAVIGAGVAWAAWSSSGSGSGHVTSTTSIDSTISPGDGSAALYPGAVASYTVTIDNPNDYPVKVDSISAGASDEVNGCTAGSVVSEAVTAPGSPSIEPHGKRAYSITVRMVADPSDACKGQTFTLPLTATLSSAA